MFHKKGNIAWEFLAGIIFLLFLSGCSNGKNYWQNRQDDAMDIFTFTVGGGFGGKIQAGPFQVSLHNYRPFAGIQSGEFFIAPEKHNELFHMDEGNTGVMMLGCDLEICYPSERAALRGKVYGANTALLPVLYLDTKGVSKKFCNHCYWESRKFLHKQYTEYCRNSSEKNRMDKNEYRRKNFSATKDHVECGGKNELFFKKPYWLFYSDINICAALGGGFRIGFNPGEMIDFLLGFGALDMANDDL